MSLLLLLILSQQRENISKGKHLNTSGVIF